MHSFLPWLSCRGAVVGFCLLLAACGSSDLAPLQSALAEQALTPAPPDVWAIRWVIPVQWAKTLGIQADSGDVVHWAKGSRHQQGDKWVHTLQLCGVQQTDFRLKKLLGDAVYASRFDDAMFDADTLPTFHMVSRVDSQTGTFVTDPVALQLGVALDNPEQAVWPTYGTQLQRTVDMDADGYPGVTATMRTDGAYQLPP